MLKIPKNVDKLIHNIIKVHAVRVVIEYKTKSFTVINQIQNKQGLT